MVEKEQGVEFGVGELVVEDGPGRAGAFVDAVAPTGEDVTVGIGDDRADGQGATAVGLPRLLRASSPRLG